MRPFVFFATPTLSGNVSGEFFLSALSTQHLCNAESYITKWRLLMGDCYLSRVKSRLATEFLDSNATDLFFLDDDIGWPPEKVIEFINRPEDIIAGAYPLKSETAQFPMIPFSEDGNATMRGNHLKMAYSTNGFMRIKRHVIEKLAEISNKFTIGSGYAVQDNATQETCIEIFRVGVYEDKFWGEDFDFSARCRALGFEIWCDTDIDFTHRGGRVWNGNYKKYLSEAGLTFD